MPTWADVRQSLNKQALLGPHPPAPSRGDLDPDSAWGCFIQGRTVEPSEQGPQRSSGCSGQAAGGRAGPGLTMRCQEQWVLGE